MVRILATTQSTDSANETMAPRRGRPRDREIDRAILESVGQIIIERGIGAATVEAVAARAGTTRTTVYRRWPSRTAMLVAVLGYFSEAPIPAPAGRSAREDLLSLFEAFAQMTRGPLGMIGPAVIAEAIRDPAVRLQVLTRAPSPGMVAEAGQRLSRALKEAGLPDTDIAIRLEAMFGLLFMRALVGNLPPEPDLPRRVVDLVIGAVPGVHEQQSVGQMPPVSVESRPLRERQRRSGP